jgi:hypothetical protein
MYKFNKMSYVNEMISKYIYENIMFEATRAKAMCNIVQHESLYATLISSGIVGISMIAYIISLHIEIFTLEKRVKYLIDNQENKKMLLPDDLDDSDDDSDGSSTVDMNYFEKKTFYDFTTCYNGDFENDLIEMEQMVDIDLDTNKNIIKSEKNSDDIE